MFSGEQRFRLSQLYIRYVSSQIIYFKYARLVELNYSISHDPSVSALSKYEISKYSGFGRTENYSTSERKSVIINIQHFQLQTQSKRNLFYICHCSFVDQRNAIFSFLYSVANIVVIQLATNYLSLISVQCYYTGWWESLISHL